jgi:periplasmic protein CpxP/Spy
MKTGRIKVLAALLAMASLATIGVAQAEDTAPPAHMHHGPMFAGPMLPFFSKALDLTDAQRTQIKEIFHNAKPTMQPLMQQERQSHQAMVQLITSGNFDQAKAQAIINQESQVHAQIEAQHALMASQAYQVLTAEQKTKMNELIAQHEQRMQERMQQRQAAPEQAPNQ